MWGGIAAAWTGARLLWMSRQLCAEQQPVAFVPPLHCAQAAELRNWALDTEVGVLSTQLARTSAVAKRVAFAEVVGWKRAHAPCT